MNGYGKLSGSSQSFQLGVFFQQRNLCRDLADFLFKTERNLMINLSQLTGPETPGLPVWRINGKQLLLFVDQILNFRFNSG